MTPQPEPEQETPDSDIVNTSGSHATDDEPTLTDSEFDELSTGTNTGQDTSDRATGLTAFT